MTHHTDAELLHALEESQSLFAAMPHEPRPTSEIQKQMEQNRAAIDAARRDPAVPVPQSEPVAYLWQHCETGRTRVVMPDMVITADANWIVVGPLYLAAAPRPPEAAPVPISDELPQGFLSDVLTAAGLVRHGKQCKALSDRLGDAVEKIWTASIAQREAIAAAPQPPEAAPVELPEPECTVVFSGYDPSDEISHGVPVGTKLYTEQQVRDLLAAHGLQEQST